MSVFLFSISLINLWQVKLHLVVGLNNSSECSGSVDLGVQGDSGPGGLEDVISEATIEIPERVVETVGKALISKEFSSFFSLLFNSISPLDC